jgi:hypothetical protein
MARTLLNHEELGACGLVANLSRACPDGTLDTIENLSDVDKERAYEFARIALNHLTAGMVANCPVQVRPCKAGAMGAFPWSWTGLTYIPPAYLTGSWLPGCGCIFSCKCQPRAALDLGRTVAEVTAVTVDGVALEDDEYRLSEKRWLYRTTGTWPLTQDMDLPPGSVGTFVVEYRPGWALGPAGEFAYGQLAMEFAKSLCKDGSCSLPKNVKMVVRRGVTMEFKEGLFPDNKTGIREVDLFVESVNPSGLRHTPRVLTPETRRREMRGV